MSNRSTPPSHLNPPKVSTTVVIGAIRASAAAKPAPRAVVGPTERLVRGGKVVVVPTAKGAVKIVGMSESDEWIAEFSCRLEDFKELYIRRMEHHVAEKTGVRIAVVG